MTEAPVVETETGKVAAGAGWFVLNLGAASWARKGEFGVRCRFEAPNARFPEFGFGVHVLVPGQPNALYHSEAAQEGFLILAGECLAVVEGRECSLRQWDYLHCPPGTAHVLVGAGDEPCAIAMIGAPRTSSLDEVSYPENPVAARHGASVTRSTRSSREAYADRRADTSAEPAPWPIP